MTCLRFPVRLHACLSGLVWLLLALVLSAQAGNRPRYVPPAQRPVENNERAWVPNQFLTIAYHDVEDTDPDQAYLGISTDQLVEQLAWLHENGYHAVSVNQILDARAGRTRLPDRSVLLSFDDGYRSFYTRVMPLLRAWNWPAILAPVGIWMDTPPDQPVDFGGLATPRERFLTWPQISEIAASGLVEIAAHTDHSHYGVIANPQGNTQPAAATRAYQPTLGRYETDAEVTTRMRDDVIAINAKIARAAGRPPRVWVWPYGAEGGVTLKILDDTGYELALTLEDGPSRLRRLMSTPRLLIANAPGLRQFANSLIDTEQTAHVMRVVHVDLDYIYDPDPAQTDRNLGELVQRLLAGVFRPGSRWPGALGVFPQPPPADARGLVQPRRLATAQPRHGGNLRVDAGTGGRSRPEPATGFEMGYQDRHGRARPKPIPQAVPV